jgi:hypothetical protein
MQTLDKIRQIDADRLTLWGVDVEFSGLRRANVFLITLIVRDANMEDIILSYNVDYGCIPLLDMEKQIITSKVVR